MCRLSLHPRGCRCHSGCSRGKRPAEEHTAGGDHVGISAPHSQGNGALHPIRKAHPSWQAWSCEQNGVAAEDRDPDENDRRTFPTSFFAKLQSQPRISSPGFCSWYISRSPSCHDGGPRLSLSCPAFPPFRDLFIINGETLQCG